MAKVVIVGGVAGGASCAARLRRLDEKAEIVLLERGEYISYANCGLPYHVGDVIKSRDSLLLQTPQMMKAKFNVDVRVQNEVCAIDRANKTVSVKNLSTGETYNESYDTLVLSTGSSPIRPPIPGIDSPRIKTLWTVPDTDEIRSLVCSGGVKTAAVIGGGFIGLEMAENLRHAGLSVSIVEMLDQVMAPLDFEMAQLLHEHIRSQGVDLYLGDGVSSFHDDGNQVSIELKSGKTLTAELVILSIGVRANSNLAKECGLSLNARGGIVTDSHMKTEDSSIYAVGDAVEVEDFIFKDRTMIPLAGPANKQGRIAADNIAGLDSEYEGTQGTAVAKVFRLSAASTGANEKTLVKRGLTHGTDYERIIITQNSHAGYYPGAVPMTIKLLFAKDSSKIFGAQIVGCDGVDKRIDTVAAAIRFGGTIKDLTKLEFAYAPPYSSAKDPVNMAGFTADNTVKNLISFADWNAPDKMKEAVLLDVREEMETCAFAVPNALNIPLGKLRKRLGELDKTKTFIVFCAIGVRAYNGARILMNNGFKNVLVYPGGTGFYRSTHYEQFSEEGGEPSSGGNCACCPPEEECCSTVSIKLDCCGLQCPGPIMKVFETIKSMQDGETVEVTASDPGFLKDIGAWCRRTGNTLVSTSSDGSFRAVIRKGVSDSSALGGVQQKSAVSACTPDGKTIVVFSGDLDKVLASFIIANGAASMGRPVTMFFTFWGLTVLRKKRAPKVKKTAMESMFGAMLPKGASKLTLSKMNMGGMGTAMMKKIMNDKNVDSLESLIKKAMANGVKIVACTMSMDVMGIKKEELIDGVELGGVGSYLGDAEESNVNLFI